MTQVKVATTSDITDGKAFKADANGQSVLIAKVGEQHCAIANKCPHLGLPMSKGKVENGVITCPFHGSKFEMCTGKNVEWVETFVGIPLPGVAKKMMAMGKEATDVANFTVTQNGEELSVDV